MRCEAAFVAYSAGRAELPGVIHLDVPEAEGEIHVKAGHLHGAPAYAVKVASGFYAEDPAAIDGLVLVFDAANGRSGRPPARRRAAHRRAHGRRRRRRGAVARATATSTASPSLGTGIQARRQVEALRCVRPDLGEIRLWGRDMDRAMRAAHDIGAMVSDSVQEAVTGASVVITAHRVSRAARGRGLGRAGRAHHGGRLRRRRQAGAGPGAAAPRRRRGRRLARAMPAARRAAARPRSGGPRGRARPDLCRRRARAARLRSS